MLPLIPCGTLSAIGRPCLLNRAILAILGRLTPIEKPPAKARGFVGVRAVKDDAIGGGVDPDPVSTPPARQSVSPKRRATSSPPGIVVPFTTGLDNIDAQLTTLERLVAEFSGVLPTETVVEIAQTLSELNTRIESVDGYLELARGAITALDANPFIPVDLKGLSVELDGLEEGLNTLSSGLDQVDPVRAEQSRGACAGRSGGKRGSLTVAHRARDRTKSGGRGR